MTQAGEAAGHQGYVNFSMRRLPLIHLIVIAAAIYIPHLNSSISDTVKMWVECGSYR